MLAITSRPYMKLEKPPCPGSGGGFKILDLELPSASGGIFLIAVEPEVGHGRSAQRQRVSLLLGGAVGHDGSP